jgi:hypothetical protein
LTTLSDLPERILLAYRAEVARLRQQLEPLELGVMRIGERRSKGRWKDITEKQIEYLRNGIAEYERSIVDLLREIDNAQRNTAEC